MNTPVLLLLVNNAISLYGVGLIWLMELVTLRSWIALDNKEAFHRIRAVHWKALPYLVFIPIAILFISSVALLFYHPIKTPVSLILFALVLQLASHILTALFYGPWERIISIEQQGPQSKTVKLLVKTHWIRTLLITLNGLVFFLITIITFS